MSATKVVGEERSEGVRQIRESGERDLFASRKLKPDHPTVRTNEAAPRAIEETDQPRQGERLDEARITPPPVSALGVEDAASNTGVRPGSPKSFPNFAYEAIRVAVSREALCIL